MQRLGKKLLLLRHRASQQSGALPMSHHISNCNINDPTGSGGGIERQGKPLLEMGFTVLHVITSKIKMLKGEGVQTFIKH